MSRCSFIAPYGNTLSNSPEDNNLSRSVPEDPYQQPATVLRVTTSDTVCHEADYRCELSSHAVQAVLYQAENAPQPIHKVKL